MGSRYNPSKHLKCRHCDSRFSAYGARLKHEREVHDVQSRKLQNAADTNVHPPLPPPPASNTDNSTLVRDKAMGDNNSNVVPVQRPHNKRQHDNVPEVHSHTDSALDGINKFAEA